MSELIEALKAAVSYMQTEIGDDGTRDTKLSRALSLLSDRSALLWALLEEEAGDVVEVGEIEDDTERDWRGEPQFDYTRQEFSVDGEAYALIIQEEDDDPRVELMQSSFYGRDLDDETRKTILCLVRGARAIQEQRKREAGAQDA